ncbi:MAG: XisI protein [Hormoscilla sp. SP5CHS1]|nr:XisI protein [Hormoscilla sp. SP12CHS1]MBC6452780.1 XisI protein [Hormoscilla sp. SP5CHS1]MBC6474531.1 XisI protein [Hormoscilla sp. GM102CHS1]MBO1352192.1 XisI protein [Hormoscilla sp. GUM202]
MEKLERHRTIVKEILTEYSQRKPSYGEVEAYTCFDEQGEHYQVIRTGWHKDRRIYGCSIHIDLKGDKIWIQYDGTEIGIANELLDRHLSKQDIVLAFHEPFARQFTEFAVG